LRIAEHDVEVGLGIVRNHAIALRNVRRSLPVVHVELGDQQLVAHAHDLIQEAAPGTFGLADELGHGQGLQDPDVRLNAKRIDGRAALAETL